MSKNRAAPESGWRNRITGHGEEAPDQLLANPRNWRVHPKAQQDALSAVLDQVGWVQDVIVNQRTGHVVDGHARIALAISKQEPSIPVVYVDLDEEEERLILASLDPLSAMATTDQEMLDDLLGGLSAEGALAEMLDELSGVAAPKSLAEYTQEIVTPIYEPTGPMPAPSDLYDPTTAAALVEEIKAADLPEDVREFLTVAARRHTVLHFDRIANYYAHASPAVQRLMEASALVIVDAEQAIERGFLAMHESIMAAFRDENPDA